MSTILFQKQHSHVQRKKHLQRVKENSQDDSGGGFVSGYGCSNSRRGVLEGIISDPVDTLEEEEENELKE
ncbi:MAG: hypothetical protein J6S82_05180 [Bacteroidales bacterium]|nr:hypothetical protein [Bacteroidales bacterium]